MGGVFPPLTTCVTRFRLTNNKMYLHEEFLFFAVSIVNSDTFFSF